MDFSDVDSDKVVVLSHSKESEYLADAIYAELIDNDVPVRKLTIEKKVATNNEIHYAIGIKTHFSLLGKIAIYVSSLINDEAILDCVRIGSAFEHHGVRRRIFVIPYVAYSTVDTAQEPGEVVLSKITKQQLSALGSTDDGTVFLFVDLHSKGLLHYFEGSCLRIDIESKDILKKAIEKLELDKSKLVFGTPNLRQTKWVNSYAKMLDAPIVFATETQPECMDTGGYTVKIDKIVGDVNGKHVIIFDDIVRTGTTIISAAKAYRDAGACEVYAVVSHLAVSSEDRIEDILKSDLKKVICTNSHPITQTEKVLKSDKFKVCSIAEKLSLHLCQILPSERNPRLTI